MITLTQHPQQMQCFKCQYDQTMLIRKRYQMAFSQSVNNMYYMYDMLRQYIEPFKYHFAAFPNLSFDGCFYTLLASAVTSGIFSPKSTS